MGTSRALLLLLLAFLVLVVPGAGEAQWVTDGRALCTANGSQVSPAIISDGAGGAIVAWQDIRNGSNFDIYAQHVLASGAVDPAWPVDGLALCTAAEHQGPPLIVSDGSGGAIVVWKDSRNGIGNDDIYAHHVLATGGVDPEWPDDGLALCTAANTQAELAIISDGAGGAIVTWEDSRSGTSDIYAQHVLSTGAVDPAWPLDGLALCTEVETQTSPCLVADGAGGAIVAWNDFRNEPRCDIYAQHVLSAGEVDPAWSSGGSALCPDADPNGSTIGIASDEAGGAFVVWTDDRDDAGDIFAQHVDSEGGVGSLDGFAVCVAFVGQYDPKIVANGAGGAIVTWRDLRTLNSFDIYAQQIGAGGGNWPVNGLALCEANFDQAPSAIVSDGAGGAIVTWTDPRNGTNDIYAQHVLSTGAVDGVWPVDGGALCTDAGDQDSPAIVGIGAGRAIVAWEDNRGTSYDIYAQLFTPPLVSIGDVTVSEGNSGTSNAVFKVRIPTPSLQPVTVQYQTHDGSATVFYNDYVGASGVATIPAQDTVTTVSITIRGDVIYESHETFTVTISNPSNAVIEDGVGQCTILNDDPLPILSINDVTVGEGNFGTTTAAFTVSLSNPTEQPVSVGYEAQDGSATVANQDYVATSGILSIPAQGTSATILVTVNGDLTYETDEVFTVVLSNPAQATLGDAVGQGTIKKLPSVRPDFPVVQGVVNASLLRGDTLYVGGDFSFIGPNTGCGVPVDASTGLALANFPRVHDPPVVAMGFDAVLAVAPDGSGGWYIGGVFMNVGGQVRNNLAHILPDYSVADWNPNPNGIVTSICVSGGTVYVGGDFTAVGGQARNRIAALDGTTGLATAWNPNSNSDVRALVPSGSILYVGGSFTTIGGQPRNRIAALDGATGLAIAWNPNANSAVQALAVSGSTVYAAGAFNAIGGQGRDGIAALDATTGLATGWYPNPDGHVLTIAVTGNTVYVGGYFSSIGYAIRPRLAALDAITSQATAWNPTSNGDAIHSVVVNGNTVYVGGDFTTIGGQSRSCLAALDATTGLATSWDPRTGPVPTCMALSGTTVYVGGYFKSLGGRARKNAAAVDVRTGLVTDWDPQASNFVTAIAGSENTVYAGGLFTTIGGQPRNSIAALDAMTGLATPWNPDANSLVEVLAVSGNTVYAGGQFTTIGGEPRNRIAGIDATTGLASPWNPSANGRVIALAVNATTVYAGGYFTTVGGQPRNYVAALDVPTGLATGWNPNPSSLVNALAIDGSAVYAGGGFFFIGGQPRGGVAALDATTGLATPWNPNVTGGPVNSIATNGSEIYLGGGFSSAGGQPRNRIAAVDATTGLATTWNPDVDDQVYTLALNDTTVYAGGRFARIGGTFWRNLAAVGSVEGPPRLSIGDVSLPEGDAGASSASFTITLTARTSSTVTVDYETFEGTATIANGDFVASSGTATIDPKTFTGTVSVPVGGDLVQEGNETFTVRITNATNAIMTDSIATCTITNDDGTPGFSINDVAIAEGDTGSVSAIFTVKLSHPTDQPVSVLYQTQDGSATLADNDYIAVSDTVFIPAKGDSATIAVALTGDLTPEPHETFSVVLSGAVNAAIADSAGIGTIVNDDPDVTPPASPSPFTGVFTGGPVQLHWGVSAEPDFAVYHLHRDTTEDFVPGPGNLVVSQADTGYVDAGSSWSYYKLSALDTTGNESGFALVAPSGQFAESTPPGTNVPVSLPNVQLTFSNVSGGGQTNLTMQTGGQAPPNGLKVAPGSPKLYYLLSTTASFTGAVTVCVTYDPANVSGQESNLKLMHYDTEEQPPGWVEVTASVDVDSNRICGTVTHFSEFALMEPLSTVNVPDEIPASVQLYSCAPNPVSGAALIRFDLSVASPVRLGLFDLQGRLVRDLEWQASKGPGRYSVPWDGRGEHGKRLRAGIYFLRLDAGGVRQMRRVALIN